MCIAPSPSAVTMLEKAVTERPGKGEPEPAGGGRAAERLRQFEESRKPTKPEGEQDEGGEETKPSEERES